MTPLVAVGRRIKVQGRRSLGLVCETQHRAGQLVEARVKLDGRFITVTPEQIVRMAR